MHSGDDPCVSFPLFAVNPSPIVITMKKKEKVKREVYAAPIPFSLH